MQERALEILKAKLLIVQREQQVEALAEIRGDQVLAEWGQQIRSYVLAPYKMVKDLRTQHETSQVSAATTSISYSLLLATCSCYRATVLPCYCATLHTVPMEIPYRCRTCSTAGSRPMWTPTCAGTRRGNGENSEATPLSLTL